MSTDDKPNKGVLPETGHLPPILVGSSFTERVSDYTKLGIAHNFSHLKEKLLSSRQGLLNDEEIKELAQYCDMISPFVDHCVRQDAQGNPVVSYGLSSMGYDIRPDRVFKLISNATQSETGFLDPKKVTQADYVTHEGDFVIIPPNGFVICNTVEYFRMPRNVGAIALSKSTYARVGLQTLCTPLEPGWEGQLVLEFANQTSRPIKLYANEGAVQLMFFRTADPSVSYADRGGKYQGQTGVQLSLP